MLRSVATRLPTGRVQILATNDAQKQVGILRALQIRMTIEVTSGHPTFVINLYIKWLRFHSNISHANATATDDYRCTSGTT
jgi:hypothetical protein